MAVIHNILCVKIHDESDADWGGGYVVLKLVSSPDPPSTLQEERGSGNETSLKYAAACNFMHISLEDAF